LIGGSINRSSGGKRQKRLQSIGQAKANKAGEATVDWQINGLIDLSEKRKAEKATVDRPSD